MFSPGAPSRIVSNTHVFILTLALLIAFFPNVKDAQPIACENTRRRFLSAVHDSDLKGIVDPCASVEYDAVVYTRMHMFVVAVPKQAGRGSSDCPTLAMEQSGTLSTEEDTRRMVNMHKVSLPFGVSPKRLPNYYLGTYPLTEIVQAFNKTKQEADVMREYDLIVNNCGDFIGQMMTNLNVSLDDNSLAQFTARQLQTTYATMAHEMRENPNTWNVLVADMETKEALSDIELIELLVESKISHLYEPSTSSLKEIYNDPSNRDRRRLRKIEMEEQQEVDGSLPLLGRRLASGIECGKWYSSSCLAETDIRYDPDGSDNIVDQSSAWSRFEGLFVGSATSYGPDGRVIEPSFVPSDDSLFDSALLRPDQMPFNQAPYKMFLNLTISGSRYYEQASIVYPPATTDFCAQPVPDGMINAYTPGQCGLNGTAGFYERFGTSSFNRDGSVVMLPFGSTMDGATLDRKSFVSIPAGDSNHFASYEEGNVLVQYTSACLDAKCDQISTTIEYYDTSATDEYRIMASTRILLNRVASAEEFKAGIQAAATEYGVPSGQLPLEDAECLSGFCPYENEWCQYDPKCAESPYVEPEAYVLAGPVIAVAMAVVVLMFGILYLFHKRAMKKKEEAFREKFANRIAEGITIDDGVAPSLSPEELVNEFNKIDKDKGGTIEKEELWAFLASGDDAGGHMMSRSDFDLLFSVVDLDKSGSVDFKEFVAFYGKCEGKSTNE